MIFYIIIAFLVSGIISRHNTEIELCITDVESLLQNPGPQAALHLQRGTSLTPGDNSTSCMIAEVCVIFCMANAMVSDIVTYDTLTVSPLVHKSNLFKHAFIFIHFFRLQTFCACYKLVGALVFESSAYLLTVNLSKIGKCTLLCLYFVMTALQYWLW